MVLQKVVEAVDTGPISYVFVQALWGYAWGYLTSPPNYTFLHRKLSGVGELAIGPALYISLPQVLLHPPHHTFAAPHITSFYTEVVELMVAWLLTPSGYQPTREVLPQGTVPTTTTTPQLHVCTFTVQLGSDLL